MIPLLVKPAAKCVLIELHVPFLCRRSVCRDIIISISLRQVDNPPALSLAEGVHPSSGLYVGAVLVVLLLAVSLAAPAMLGMGDVKLALLILCALDAFAPLALLITLELYALIALYLLSRRGRAALKMSLSLAPITTAACLIVLML